MIEEELLRGEENLFLHGSFNFSDNADIFTKTLTLSHYNVQIS